MPPHGHHGGGGGGGWHPWGHRWGGGPWGGWPDPIYVVAEPAYTPLVRLVPRERSEVAVCAGVTNIGKGLDRCADGSIVYDRTLYEERSGKLVRRGSALLGVW